MKSDLVSDDHGKPLMTLEFCLPASWASYLINGDASGIEAEEQAQADLFLESESLPGPVSCSDESEFRRRNDASYLGGSAALAGDTLTYTFLIHGASEVDRG